MITHMENLEIGVKQELTRRYPGCRVDLRQVQKNNGLMLWGISISAMEKNISPIIYIDEYLARGYSVKQICDEVSRVFEDERNIKTLETDLKNFQEISGKICFKLVNAEENREWLKGIPHRRLYDLAVVYYILLDDEFDGMATINITSQLAACWGIEEEELFWYAVKNTRKLLHVVVYPLGMLYDSIMAKEEPEAFKNGEKEFSMTVKDGCEWNMYIMSNKDRTFGAVTMLYTDILQKIANQLRADFYMLPSSTHELIIVPDSGEESGSVLFEMVCQVNRNDVRPDEFLANNVYYYNSRDNCVTSLYYQEK